MKTNAKYDFGAYATRYNVKCADGRTLLPHAFDDCDGETVSLIWNHDHENPYSIIGHALLEKREDGVYSYLSFNDSDLGKHCKALVEHGDVKGVSIYANKLTQDGHKNVSHGVIRELSLVLAGANPGAFIDTVLAHHEDLEDATLCFNMDNNFEASETEEEPKEEPKQEELAHSEEGDKEMTTEKTVGQVFDEIKGKLSEEEMNVVYGLIGMAANGAGEEGGEDMKHNAFEGSEREDEVLIHDALHEIWEEGIKNGHFKDACLAHAEELAEYGLDNIEYLQAPEGTDIYKKPYIINTHPDGWVAKINNGISNSPLAKVRMMFADITVEEARAKGYIKGDYKEESFFGLQKRTVEPTTVYVKQKFDRDDLIDADFEVAPFVKSVMDVKMDEELARAYIFGDGRSARDKDKVNDTHIIPVVKEDELFVNYVEVDGPASTSKADQDAFAENIIDEMILAQDDYVGSGNITAFIVAQQVSKMLLLKDQFGHRLYKTMAELASAMGVSEVVKVPKSVMPADHYVVALDLSDYQTGKKDKGNKAWYNDFDIDYNQEKFLLETRRSGCLVRPKSAIVIKKTSNAG